MKKDMSFLAEYNKLDEVKKLIQEGADVNKKDEFGYTPLQKALANEHDEMAELLLNNGADTSIQDNDGNTALHYAYVWNMTDIAKKIIDMFPETLSIENKYGNQPLWTAVMNAKIPEEDIKYLLKKGADRNHKNKTGSSTLDLVKSYNIDEFTKLFIEN